MTESMGDADGEPAPDEGADGSAVDPLLAELVALDEAVAAEVDEVIGDLEADLANREERIGDLESKVKRAQADLRNYKRRTEDRIDELEARATESLVERLLDVRDNLVRALEQDADADVRDGVEATLATFDRVLGDEDVEAIDPEPGADVDPERHEVVARVESDRPADEIDEVYRPGYEMAGRVLRPAQVTVSEGPEEAVPVAEADDDEPAEP